MLLLQKFSAVFLLFNEHQSVLNDGIAGGKWRGILCLRGRCNASECQNLRPGKYLEKSWNFALTKGEPGEPWYM